MNIHEVGAIVMKPTGIYHLLLEVNINKSHRYIQSSMLFLMACNRGR